MLARGRWPTVNVLDLYVVANQVLDGVLGEEVECGKWKVGDETVYIYVYVCMYICVCASSYCSRLSNFQVVCWRRKLLQVYELVSWCI